MNVATAVRLRDSFAKTAAEELAEDLFPKDQRDKVLTLFKDALAQADVDLEKHLPNIDESNAGDILGTLGKKRRNAPAT